MPWTGAQTIRAAARLYPAFRAKIAEKNAVVPIRTKDMTVGRWYAFHDGRLKSRSGLRDDADVTLLFKDRLLYPLKRDDFDPNGERNPQNRGLSGYEREFLDGVATMFYICSDASRRPPACSLSPRLFPPFRRSIASRAPRRPVW